MDRAMANAQHGTFHFQAQRAATPGKELSAKIPHQLPTKPSSVAAVNSVASVCSLKFKARSMPNFKAIHDKHTKEVGDRSINSKENIASVMNSVKQNACKPDLSGKAFERKVAYVEKSKEKKAEFLAARRSMTPGRGVTIGSRPVPPKSPFAANPFQYTCN
jgi:hypothetical protein